MSDWLLGGVPALAISYGQFAKTTDAHGWDIRSYGPRPEEPDTTVQFHLAHRTRTELDGTPQRASIIVTQAQLGETVTRGEPRFEGEWIHASIYLGDGILPIYDDLVMLHRAVFGRRRHAWQCFVPESEHVNIKDVLHLWGRVDGANLLPDLGAGGNI